MSFRPKGADRRVRVVRRIYRLTLSGKIQNAVAAPAAGGNNFLGCVPQAPGYPSCQVKRTAILREWRLPPHAPQAPLSARRRRRLFCRNGRSQSKSLIFSVRERTASPAARIDIEIFGLGLNIEILQLALSEATTSLTCLKRHSLNVGQPLPLAERRRYLFELRTRDGDVGNASNNFPLYVRCTYSNHGRPDGSSGRGCAPIFLGDP
jgi:hypothetical protein